MVTARIQAAWRDRRAALVERVGIDARALAAYRIAIAALVLVDLALYRAPDLAVFYTDAGVLPRRLLADRFPVAADVSLHTLAGSLPGQAILLGLTGLAALALLVGYRARWVALATWLLVVSMQARNPHVVNGGDTLAIATLFFGLFLPLGRRWSIDATRREPGTPSEDEPVANAASLGLLLQVLVVYLTNLVFKTRGPRWMDGTAVAHVFALDDFTVRLGDVLAGQDALLVAANWTWVATLAATPLLVLLTGWARAALAGWLATLHLGMLATLMLGPFPLVSIAALLVFVPPVAWDRLEARLRPVGRRLAARLPASTKAPSSIAPHGAGTSTRRVVHGVLGVAIVLGLVWHGMALGWIPEPEVVDEAGRAGEHSWSMFAPASTTYGWTRASANLSDGQRVDALQLEPAPVAPPEDLADAYPSTLWHRYLKDLPDLADAEQGRLAAYLCERVDRAYEAEAETVRLVYVEREVVLDEPDPAEPRLVEHHECR
jgi:hypothetical protein